MSDFDAARKRLERHADELSYVAEQDPHYSAEEGLIAGDIRLLLAEVERLRAALGHAIRYGNAQRAIVVKLDAELAAERQKTEHWKDQWRKMEQHSRDVAAAERERAEKAEAEVERLEEELRSWHEGDNECCKLRHEAQIAREEALAEVERLKANILDFEIGWGNARQRAEKAEAEVERLKQLFDRVVVKPGAYTEAVQQAEKAEAGVERLRAWIKDCGNLCNCGAFDTDQLVTRGECGDCVATALRGEGEK